MERDVQRRAEILVTLEGQTLLLSIFWKLVFARMQQRKNRELADWWRLSTRLSWRGAGRRDFGTGRPLPPVCANTCTS